MTSGPALDALILDATQRAVLDAGAESHLSVVGAPGSGKTTTLVELLAERVLRDGLATTEVLALTPDRRSAARLREVIGERLAVSTPGAMARTPESVAFEIVRADRARQGMQAPQLFTGADEDTILAELIQSDLEARAVEGPEQLNATPIDWAPPVTLEAIGLRGFRAEIRDLLAAMSEYDVTPERLEELAHLRPVWSGAAALARQFRESVAQAKPNAFDTPGIVLEAVSIVHSATRLDSFSRLKLLLVDDVHEFTESGRRLLVAFALRGVRVVSFGDPDITTGGFRGSRPELAVDWRGETRGALEEPRRLVLGTVHRGGAELRAFVRGVTDGIGVQRELRHRAAESAHAGSPPASAPPAVARFSASSSAAECRGIADYLRELHLLHDVPWDEMAVITRRGGSIESIRRQLAKLEVPTSSSQALPAARDKAVQAVVKLAAIASGAEELTPEAIAELAASPVFAIDPVQLRRVRRALRLDEIAAGGNRAADELLVEAVSRVAGLRLLTDPDAPASATFERLLATGGSASGRSATKTLQQLGSLLRAVAGEIDAAGGQQRSIAADEVLYAVWERLGVAKTWREAALGSGPRAEQMGAHLDALVTLFDVGKRFVERQPDASIHDFLVQWSGSEVTADSLAGRTNGGTVTVTTPAAVLGRQFRVVVVAGLSDGVWPNLRLRDSLLGAGQLAELERGIDTTRDLVDRRLEVLYDERRMFAQAVSRSSEWLLLTAEESEDSAPSPFFLLSSRTWNDSASEVSEAQAALTLRGLVGELRRAGIVRGVDPSDAAGLARLAQEDVPGADPAEWYGLGGATTGRPLHDPGDPSASIPVSPSNIESFEDCGVNWFVSSHGGGSTSESMNIGNIVHAAAEFDFPDLEARTAFAQARLRSNDFEAPWQETAVRAKVDELVRNLSAYLHRVTLGGGALLGAERAFTVEVRVEGEESAKITLRGKIDRIESTAAGSIDVVDFKTGKSMPSSDSMATNAQLAAYQLALSTGAVSDPVDRPVQAVELPPRSDRGETIPPAQVHEAKLVFLAKPTTKQEWSERTQHPFDETATSEFFERVRNVALGMIGIPEPLDQRSPTDALASAHYQAHLESHCLGSFGGGRACALHAAPEVTE